MSANSITRVTGRGVYVAGNDIDTDRIIPARFLKCVTFDELGPSLFYDERFDATGHPKGHPLDDKRHAGASILISDDNFGCGSSREHAPQALQKFGFRAVVAGSFAEIFHGNATTLGIPCIVLRKPDREHLAEMVKASPAAEITIDLETMQLTSSGTSLEFSMKASAREAFLAGTFDPLDNLLAAMDDIKATARRLGYSAQD